MQEVPHSVCGHSCLLSAWAYSRSKCQPYNNRTWTAIYTTRLYGTKGLWFWVAWWIYLSAV